MEYVWWFMVLMTLIVYPVALVRGALRGRPWALDTLKAMRYLGGDMMTYSAWRALPPEPDPPVRSETVEAEPEPRADEAEGEPGRLVA